MNLEGKTIFDLCDDKDVIYEIIGGKFSETYYRGFSRTVIYDHIVAYALKIDDMNLYSDAVKMLETAEREWEEKREGARKKGEIID